MAEIERVRDMYAQGFTVARCLAAGDPDADIALSAICNGVRDNH
jgi:hypothetical protein